MNVLKSGVAFAAVVAMLVASAARGEDEKVEDSVDEIVVVGRTVSTTTTTVEIEKELLVDTAVALKEMPGANVNSNGLITGIAQYRGLHGDRVAVSIDSLGVVSGGPNAMDAPLSYASPMMTKKLVIERGIASLASAPETIGGHINASVARGDFGDAEFGISGIAGTRFSSNGNVSTTVARLTLADDRNRVSLIGEVDRGDDIMTPVGELQPSRLDRRRYDLSYAYSSGNNEILAFAGKLDTTDTGTPALPMDIRAIDTDLYGLRFATTIAPGVRLEGLASYNRVFHEMDNYFLRPVATPMMARMNNADGSGTTYKVISEFELDDSKLKIGLDGVLARHDSVITNPNMAMFRIDNFVDVQRDLFGAFAEWRHVGAQSEIELGLRYKRIDANSGTVDAAGMAGMMAMNAAILRDDFNSSNRDLSWDSVDAVFKLQRPVSSSAEWSIELGSKTRAPYYQELYLWLPLQSAGGLADGQTYIGNLNLRQERSNEIVVGFSADTRRIALSPQIFYKRIDNYIQGVPSTNTVANMLAVMMTGAPPLQFDNVDAEIWGLDVAWKIDLTERLFLDGIVTLVNGKRVDVNDDLYRLAPLNGSVGITYASDAWSLNAELVGYAKQDRLSEYNGEQETAGYGTINVGFGWNAMSSLRVEARVENLTDKAYQDHLAGVNRAGDGDIPIGTRLYSAERTLRVGAIYRF